MITELDQDTQRLIERELEAGHFQNAGEVVEAAVRQYLFTREDLGYSRDEIDLMIDDAKVSSARGLDMDGEEFFDELEKEERQSQHSRE